MSTVRSFIYIYILQPNRLGSVPRVGQLPRIYGRHKKIIRHFAASCFATQAISSVATVANTKQLTDYRS